MPVHYERRGAAALVTIDRPQRRNAVDGPAAQALAEGHERFEADDEARVLVLTGSGEEAFCAGADLKALDTLGPRLADLGGPLGFTRRIATKPTIAAIAGWCLAGGLELALWCDLRIAAQGATLGFPERRWGVPLVDGGTQRLPRVVGLGRALDMTLTGRMVGDQEALAIGLVTELVERGRHVERALELAEALAAFPQQTMLADRAAMLEGIGAHWPRAWSARRATARPPSRSPPAARPASPGARAVAAWGCDRLSPMGRRSCRRRRPGQEMLTVVSLEQAVVLPASQTR